MTPKDHHAPGFFYKVFWKREENDNEAWSQRIITDWKECKLVVENTPTFKPYR